MFKKLNIADWISLYRIIALPFLVLAIILDEKILFGWLLLVSLLSDVVDGYLARKLNEIFAMIDKVSAEDIKRVAGKYFINQRLTVATISPSPNQEIQ